MKFSCEDDNSSISIEVESSVGYVMGCRETFYIIQYNDDDENQIVINEKMMPRFIDLCNQARNYVLECKKEREKPAILEKKFIRDNKDDD